MTMQQINLYVPELRPQRELLSARQAAVLSAVFVAVLILVHGVWQVRATHLAGSLAEAQARVDELTMQVDRLRASVPAADAQRFDETLRELRAAIDSRQSVRRIISGQNMGNARGFQQALLGLARASQGDLALERFTLSRGGNYVEMRGRTRAAGAVPLYLQRLRSTPVFEQARFGLLTVSSEADDRPGYEFSLGYDNLYRPQPGSGRRP